MSELHLAHRRTISPFHKQLPLYHFDLYRLEPKEVASLHLETYWEGVEMPLGIVAIEWAERLQYKPNVYLQVRLTYQTNDSRQAHLIPVGEFPPEVSQLSR